jgi:hypothetical protein
MTVYYTDIRALIDPEQSDPLPGCVRASRRWIWVCTCR